MSERLTDEQIEGMSRWMEEPNMPAFAMCGTWAARELRERRAADLSAEEVEALREIRAEIDEFGMAVDDDATAGIAPARRRALSVLDRLLAKTGRK